MFAASGAFSKGPGSPSPQFLMEEAVSTYLSITRLSLNQLGEPRERKRERSEIGSDRHRRRAAAGFPFRHCAAVVWRVWERSKSQIL